VTDQDLAGKNAQITTLNKIINLIAETDKLLTY